MLCWVLLAYNPTRRRIWVRPVSAILFLVCTFQRFVCYTLAGQSFATTALVDLNQTASNVWLWVSEIPIGLYGLGGTLIFMYELVYVIRTHADDTGVAPVYRCFSYFALATPGVAFFCVGLVAYTCAIRPQWQAYTGFWMNMRTLVEGAGFVIILILAAADQHWAEKYRRWRLR